MEFEEALHLAHTSGLVYFIVLFAAVLIYALRPSSRKKFKDAADIPLRED